MLLNKYKIERFNKYFPLFFKKLIFNTLLFPISLKWKFKRFIPKNKKGSIKAFDVNKAIFIHIPKAAGNSVKRSIFGTNFVIGHHSLNKYELIFSKKEFTNYYKFTFVRNPWSRVYSAYNFLSKGGFHDKDKKWFKNNLAEYNDFNHFVKEWLNKKNIYTYIHFIPQYHFISSSNLDVGVDFVGKVENIQNDFKIIIDKLNLNSIDLNHLNKTNTTNASKHYDYKQFYNKESIEIVRKVYQRDIQLFNYKFNEQTN